MLAGNFIDLRFSPKSYPVFLTRSGEERRRESERRVQHSASVESFRDEGDFFSPRARLHEARDDLEPERQVVVGGDRGREHELQWRCGRPVQCRCPVAFFFRRVVLSTTAAARRGGASDRFGGDGGERTPGSGRSSQVAPGRDLAPRELQHYRELGDLGTLEGWSSRTCGTTSWRGAIRSFC